MTTKNKITIEETLYMLDKIVIRGFRESEYISIIQGKDIIDIQTDEIQHIISSLQRFQVNGEIAEV